jgi:hypothetical protein
VDENEGLRRQVAANGGCRAFVRQPARSCRSISDVETGAYRLQSCAYQGRRVWALQCQYRYLTPSHWRPVSLCRSCELESGWRGTSIPRYAPSLHSAINHSIKRRTGFLAQLLVMTK